jgi:hypothetical protein
MSNGIGSLSLLAAFTVALAGCDGRVPAEKAPRVAAMSQWADVAYACLPALALALS